VAARRAKALALKQEAPFVSDHERDNDIVWAYKHFRSNPSKAPTDSKAFWLMIAQKNPDAFYTDHFVEACERLEERRREDQRRQENPNYDYERGYRDGYDEGFSACECGEPHQYEDDEEDEDDEVDEGLDDEDYFEEEQEAPPAIADVKASSAVVKEAPVSNGSICNPAPHKALEAPPISPQPPSAPIPEVMAPPVIKAIQEPQRPTLCARCRVHGYPTCEECTLASDPGLELDHGVIYRTSNPPEPVVKGWHRCEGCNKPYEGIRPSFGTPKLCTECIRP
jgi:hypothetical protein